jgi:hypothetical protein
MAGMRTPSPRIDKYESRRIRVQIRHVLLDTSDPIGVKDEPNARDEYDGYIGRLYELLTTNGSEAEVTEYLYWAVHEHMGLDRATKQDMAATVDALRRISLPVDSD